MIGYFLRNEPGWPSWTTWIIADEVLRDACRHLLQAALIAAPGALREHCRP